MPAEPRICGRAHASSSAAAGRDPVHRAHLGGNDQSLRPAEEKYTGQMITAEAAAKALQPVYVDELLQSLLRSVHPMVNRRQTEVLVGWAPTAEPAACTEPDAATWIWTDARLEAPYSWKDAQPGWILRDVIMAVTAVRLSARPPADSRGRRRGGDPGSWEGSEGDSRLDGSRPAP